MNAGKLHVLIIHFPIALALCALLADLLWLASRRQLFRHSGLYCLVLAALSAVPSVLTGMAAARSQEFVGSYVPIVASHQWWGIATLVVAVLAAAIRLVRHNRLRGRWLAAYGLLMTVLAVGVTLTGHSGGRLVHGKGFLSGLL